MYNVFKFSDQTIIVMGRTASGKTTLIQKIMDKLQKENVDAFFLATATTRDPRDEKDKLEYTFLSNEEFDNTDFLSFINPGGWVKYGVLKNENIRKGVGFFSPISLSYGIDTAVGLKYKNVTFVVLDISREERYKRLNKRGEAPDAIERRFEIENTEGEYDLSLLPNDTLVLNNDKATTDELVEIVMEKLFT